MIVAAFISDRGDRYLPHCRESFEQHVDGNIHATCIVDDREHNLGLAGAARQAWEWATQTDADYLFHVEEDFTFNDRVRVDDLARVLDAAPQLAQVVLKRQPARPEDNSVEHAAGGIIECDPDAYRQWFTRDSTNRHMIGFAEHRKCFSLNPCLIPRRVFELGWPDGNEAEFTQTCLERGWTFAFYGKKSDPPLVHHHGVRSEGWKP